MFRIGFVILAVSTLRKSTSRIGSSLVRPSKGGRRIGFYGCFNAGRVVSVTLGEHIEDHRKYPHHRRLDCPACGSNHDANFTWRALNPHEEDRQGEVILW